jgi:hypothetical protein
MTDHPSLYGSTTAGSLDAKPSTVTTVQEGQGSEMSFHLMPDHPIFGFSIIVITKHLRDIVYQGRVTTAQNSRTVSIRGLTAEGLPKGSVKFNGPKEDVIHFLNQHMIREEDVQASGSMAPMEWLDLVKGASLPLGTKPAYLWTFRQGIPTFEKQDVSGKYRVLYVMSSMAFPEISFGVAGPWMDGFTEGLLIKAWWQNFNKKFPGTVVARYGSTKSAL